MRSAHACPSRNEHITILDSRSIMFCNFCHDRNNVQTLPLPSADRALRPPLGRDGRRLGRQPLRGADPCPAVRQRSAAHSRGHRRAARHGPLQRIDQPARAAVVEPHPPRACHGRPARLLRGRGRHVRDGPAHRAGRKAREIDPALAVLRSCVAEAEGDAAVSPTVRKRRSPPCSSSLKPSTAASARSCGCRRRRCCQAYQMGGAVARFAEAGKGSKNPPARRMTGGYVSCQPLEVSNAPRPKPRHLRRRRADERQRQRSALPHARRRSGLGRAARGGAPPLLQMPRAGRDARSTAANVVATELSRAGRVLAFLARAIGSPLPLTDGATGPALVVVTEDARLGGQSWLRIYARPGTLSPGRFTRPSAFAARRGSRSTSAAVLA